jgi:hypothetical protein
MASKKPNASELEIEPSTEDPEPEITAGNGADADTDATRAWAPAVASPMENFDFDALSLPQDFDAHVGAKPVLTAIEVRRPTKFEWVRTHPSPAFQRLLGLVEVPSGTYVVHQNLAPMLGRVVEAKLLVATITTHGVLLLWPLRQPAPDGRTDKYMTSENQAAARARDRWMRIASNQHARAYDVLEATAKMREPEWPELDFAAWLQLAFNGRVVASPDHPLMRELLTGAE